MKHRNPLLAGLFNVLIPGSIHLYLRNDWRKFTIMFFIYGFGIFALVLIGNNIEILEQYKLPDGACTGILVFLGIAYLFYKGAAEAIARNGEISSAVHYQTMRNNISGKEKNNGK